MQMNEQAIVRADDMKRPIPLYDFKAFGEAIKKPGKKRERATTRPAATSISPRVALPISICRYEIGFMAASSC